MDWTKQTTPPTHVDDFTGLNTGGLIPHFADMHYQYIYIYI